MSKNRDDHILPGILRSRGYHYDAKHRIWSRSDAEPFAYSDGDTVEQRLWDAIKHSGDVSLFSTELRQHQTDWPSTYHLSPVRANLLRPLSGLIAGSRILEIGAGCGAITRYLGEQGAKVVALEGSPRRAAIAAERCRDLDGVTVVSDRFEDFEIDQRFDVVSLIGVLEYARAFASGSGGDPIQDTLRKALSLLADDGILLVAIENQLGLKYFAGAKEDHLGRTMAGIQDHYSADGVVTFGRRELERRVRDAGFATLEFALPFPDYKLPQSLVLPAGYAIGSGFNASSLAGQAAHSDRQLDRTLFAMEPAFGVVGRNGLLADMANSFLVLAGKSPSSPDFSKIAPATLAAHYAAERPPAYAKGTRFVRDRDGILAVRDALCPGVEAPRSSLISHSREDERYLPGMNWGDHAAAIVSKPGWSIDDLAPWLATWRSALARTIDIDVDSLTVDTLIPGRFFDAVPRNLVVDGDETRFFDLEWRSQNALSVGFLAFRAVRTSFDGVSAVAMPADPLLLHLPTLLRALFRRMGLLVTGNEIQRYFDLEASFQDEIHGLLRKAPPATVVDEMMMRVAPDTDALLAQNDSALRSALSTLQARESELSELRSERETLTQALAGARMHARDLEKAVGEASAASAQSDASVAAMRAASRELESRILEAERISGRKDAEIESLRAAMEHAIELKDNEINGLWTTIGELKTSNAEQAGTIEAQTRQLSSLALWERTAKAQQDELALIKNSRSWKLTVPLRGGMSAFRGAASRSRVATAKFAKQAYRIVPMPQATKQKIKGAIFRTFSGVLGGTNAYRRWQAFESLSAPAQSPAKLSAPYATHAAHAAASTPTSVFQDALWHADGAREWAEYRPLRDRIAAAQSERMLTLPRKPRKMLDFSGQDLAKAAAKIALPAPPVTPDVTILIPIYNHLHLTLECLASIAATASDRGPSFEVLIANDASSDDSAAVLARIAHVRIVDQPRNLGFLRNCNSAARRARGRHLLLLNNDVQVTEGWLRRMVDRLESDESIGAVGPKIVYPNGALQEAGASLRRDGTADMIGLNDDPNLPRYAFDREVDYCSGACLLLRRADFEALGGFDERYAPAYCEDSDLCMRLRERGKRIVYCADAEVVHHLSKTSAGLDSDYKLACIANNLQTFASTWQERLDRMTAVRTIAFYLPQFHPIPENDLWWGRGFTEWTNVSKARPNFVGHYQPRVPSDLGYYDLRLPEVMRQQAELARRYGVGGFCFYYYWFAGKRLLETPIEQFLADETNTMPFCLCWANENWTRRWDGQEKEVLMAQHHSPEDDEAAVRDLMRYFAKGSYIRIDGRPLLLIYRANLFPDFAATAARWRKICREAGIGEIYLAHVESFELTMSGVKPDRFGCDAAIEFPPHGMAETYAPKTPLLNPDFIGMAADYRDLATRFATRPLPDYKRFLGVMPSWDNTARRQNHSYVFEESTPGAFQAWLEVAIANTRQQYCGDERIVFINAWNEWAEGAHLEPDRRFGHAFLEAVKNAQESTALLRHDAYSLGD
jgi:GT2 family glycosyltransferase/SAM-dependent methyltransferase